MSLKMGLEKEFFLLQGEEPVLVPDYLPMDDCQWLVEARGPVATNIFDAVYLLQAEVARIQDNLRKHDQVVVLSDEPVMKVSKQLRLQAMRRAPKGVIQYQNFYGHEDHKVGHREETAGVHISFSDWRTKDMGLKRNERSESYEKLPSFEYSANFDWPKIFVGLDKAFAEEIRAAKRNPGFYEIKPDGRVEYRSLPANVNLDKLIQVVRELVA